jgi:hypothetical protein
LLTGTRTLFAAIAALALVAGYMGIAQVKPELGSLDVFYGTLQLFVLGNPLFDESQPWPWFLNVARFAAPAVTAYAIFETVRLIAAEQARWLRALTVAGHTIVAGDTPFADAITGLLQRRGTTVTQIRGATDAAALRSAGIGRADVLIACADHRTDPWVNLVAALDASQIERDGRPLTIHAQIADATLAFTARSLGMTPASKLNVRFFNMEELAAAALAKEDGLNQDIAIVGMQAFGSALLVELARAWQRQGQTDALRVTIVGDDAESAVARLTATNPILATACALTAVDAGHVPSGQAFSRVYVCYQDEAKALSTALATPALWPADAGGLVVRLDRLTGIGQAFGGQGRLLDDMQGRLRMISVLELASSAVATEREDVDERIARAIHERYLTQQLARGTAMGVTPAMAVWEQLPEDLRNANRAQAAGIRDKLNRIGCAIAVLDSPQAFSYRREELEMLSRLEHERWMADKLAAGWTYGNPRDDAARQHDCLVPWEQLAESEREKDRDAVRNIPGLLADVGLQPVRLKGRRNR